VQFVQARSVDIAGLLRDIPTGLTLVIDVNGRVRFVVRAPDVASRKDDMLGMARLAFTTPLGWTVSDGSTDPFAVDYRGMHEART
jgi:hypothetical protein